jgi:peptide/nickel transport system ATP-binding protein
VRAAYDLPATIPDSAVEEAVADAVAALLGGDSDRAAAALADAVTTPCAETAPEFTDHGGGHRAACLRHRPEYGGFDAG